MGRGLKLIRLKAGKPTSRPPNRPGSVPLSPSALTGSLTASGWAGKVAQLGSKPGPSKTLDPTVKIQFRGYKKGTNPGTQDGPSFPLPSSPQQPPVAGAPPPSSCLLDGAPPWDGGSFCVPRDLMAGTARSPVSFALLHPIPSDFSSYFTVFFSILYTISSRRRREPQRAMIQAAPLSDSNGNGGVALLGEQIFCSSDRLRWEFASPR